MHSVLYVWKVNFSLTSLTPDTFLCFLLLFHFLFCFPVLSLAFMPLLTLFFVIFFQHYFSSSIFSFIVYLVSFPHPIVSTLWNILPIFHMAIVPSTPVHAWGISVFHYLIAQINIPMLFFLIIHLNSSVMNSQLLTSSHFPIASTNDI